MSFSYNPIILSSFSTSIRCCVIARKKSRNIVVFRQQNGILKTTTKYSTLNLQQLQHLSQQQKQQQQQQQRQYRSYHSFFVTYQSHQQQQGNQLYHNTPSFSSIPLLTKNQDCRWTRTRHYSTSTFVNKNTTGVSGDNISSTAIFQENENSVVVQVVVDEDEDTALIQLLQRHPLFRIRTTSLGLLDYTSQYTLVPLSVLKSIRQLPEIDSILSTTTTTSTSSMTNIISSLQRAVNVFESFANGGNEHKAVLAILAECYLLNNNLTECLSTIQLLHKLCSSTSTDSNNNSNKISNEQYQQMNLLMLVQAKVYWINGNFNTSQQICESIINHIEQGQNDDNTSSNTPTNIYEKNIMLGIALSQLLQMPINKKDNKIQLLEKAIIVREPFRKLLYTLQNTVQYSNTNKHINNNNNKKMNLLSLAIIYLHMGIAEIVYAEAVVAAHSYQLGHDVPIDRAMKHWKAAVRLLQGDDDDDDDNNDNNTTYLKSAKSINDDDISHIIPLSDEELKEFLTNDNSEEKLVDDDYKNKKQHQSKKERLRTIDTHPTILLNMEEQLRNILLIQLNNNLAWGILQLLDGPFLENDVLLKDASNYIQKSFTYNKQYNNTLEGYYRTLTLAGICYTHTDNPITAEGLFESAIDISSITSTTNNTSSSVLSSSSNSSISIIPNEFSVNPKRRIEYRDALVSYGNSCFQWTKRETQGQRLVQQGIEFDTTTIPLGWSERSSIHSSLWFTTIPIVV